ncbi:MAG: hypothetical protein ACHP8A_07300 [Terriglobales bacterium]|jgi:hypothetical protein|nr:hypothetical protein [Terriglobales bacterium]
MLVTSISLSGEAHSFPLDQVPDLYDITDIDHYATESKVVFLLRAASGDGQVPVASGQPSNDAEHHLYIAIFNRDGTYQKTLQVADDFRIYQLGLFPSGNYLAYGYDKNDHSPKLAMLKDDVTILKYLQAPKGGVPDSPLGTLDGKGKGAAVYLAPVQFAGRNHSIYVVQSKTDYPLLEVTEAGEIREIHPKLPEGSQINMLIPSDESLYALVGEKDNRSIYEIDAVSGDLLKHFQVSKDQPGASVACVNGGKFLSFEDIKEKLVPLIGTAEPGVSASN